MLACRDSPAPKEARVDLEPLACLERPEGKETVGFRATQEHLDQREAQAALDGMVCLEIQGRRETVDFLGPQADRERQDRREWMGCLEDLDYLVEKETLGSQVWMVSLDSLDYRDLKVITVFLVPLVCPGRLRRDPRGPKAIPACPESMA